MKARFSTQLVTFELEANTQAELFKLLAETQEVFGERCCGMCDKGNLRFVVREVDGNHYHEYHCLDCNAKLSLGQSRQNKGSLFPIRKLTAQGKPSRKEGTFDTKHRGWTKYRGEPEKPEA